jgi:hypothetical protein
MTNSSMRWMDGGALAKCLVAIAALLAIQAGTLLVMGQPPICACGTVKLWHGAVDSAENSQHLTDWYTFSHIIHGVLFYLLLWLIMPRWPVVVRLAVAVGLEAGWEIFENTPFVIGRYRQSALAQGYSGDSVVNSVSDTLAMITGFVLDSALPRPATIALAVALELFPGVAIRDNLTLNIIQLVHPSDAFSRWQSRR